MAANTSDCVEYKHFISYVLGDNGYIIMPSHYIIKCFEQAKVVSKEKRKLLDLKRDAGKVNALKWKSTNQKCWRNLKPNLKHCIILLPSVLNYTQRHNKDSSHEIYPFLTSLRRTTSSAIMHDVADLVNDGASGDLGKAMCIHPEPYHRMKDFSDGYDHNIIGLPIAKMCAGMVRTVDGYWTFLVFRRRYGRGLVLDDVETIHSFVHLHNGSCCVGNVYRHQGYAKTIVEDNTHPTLPSIINHVTSGDVTPKSMNPPEQSVSPSDVGVKSYTQDFRHKFHHQRVRPKGFFGNKG